MNNMKHKILSLLVLLLTVASGAWADWNGGTYTATANETIEGTVTVSANATLTIAAGKTVTINGGLVINNGVTLTVDGTGTLVVKGTKGTKGSDGSKGNDGNDGAAGQALTPGQNGESGNPGGKGQNGGIAISGNIIIKGANVQATGGKGGEGGEGGKGGNGGVGTTQGNGGTGGNGGDGGQGGAAFSGTVVLQSGTIIAKDGVGGNGGYGGMNGAPGNSGQGSHGTGGNGGTAFAGTLTVYIGNVNATGGNGGFSMNVSGTSANAFTNDVTIVTTKYTMTDGTNAITTATGHRTVIINAKDPNIIDTTTDAASEGATFTTASFNMPTSDATVEYDIVRDMADATYPVEFSGITANASVVVKKNAQNKFVPATTLDIQLIDQLAATDAQNIIEATGITIKVFKGTKNNDVIEYGSTYITLNEFLTDMQPGYYKIVAEPTDATTSPYTGTASLEFQTLEGYPVEIPANEYATFYSDQPLHVEDIDNVALYTITSVSGDKAILTPVTYAPSYTPLIVMNKSGQAITAILIPDSEEPIGTAPTVYSGFKGTLSATQLQGSTDELKRFVFSGTAFIIVKDAIEIGANRCYLEVAVTNAPVLNLVFDDNLTGIESINVNDNENDNGNDNWYDLNGRKLSGKPAQKGVYVRNGRKVVIK